MVKVHSLFHTKNKFKNNYKSMVTHKAENATNTRFSIFQSHKILPVNIFCISKFFQISDSNKSGMPISLCQNCPPEWNF